MTTQESSSDRCTGQVKWFNNRAGYGFVTATSGDKEGEDIFAHHSMITVDREQYKYLVQGEYVEFSVVSTEEGVEHECQAGHIKGVNSGKLMCETRFDNRRPPRRPRDANASQNTENGLAESSETTEQQNVRSTNRRGGGGPRQGMKRGGRRPNNNNRAKKSEEQSSE